MITTICQALCGEGVEQQTVVGVAKRETPWLDGGDGWLYGSGLRYRCGDARLADKGVDLHGVPSRLSGDVSTE